MNAIYLWIKSLIFPSPRTTEQKEEVVVSLREGTYRMAVPEGTEWAPSIPWPMHWLANSGVWFAAIFHDELYVWKGSAVLADFDLARLLPESPSREVKVNRVGRGFSDRFFLNVMRQRNVGWLRRTLIYKVVDWFGGPAWRETDDVLEDARSSDT